MPTERTYTKKRTVQKSKFSNFGYSKFSTKTINTEYFAKKAEANVFAFRNSAEKIGKSAANLGNSAAKFGNAFVKTAKKTTQLSGLSKSGNLSSSKASLKRPTMRGAMPTNYWHVNDSGKNGSKLEYNSTENTRFTNEEVMPKTYTWWNDNTTNRNSSVASRQTGSYASRSYAVNRSATNYFTGGRKVTRSFYNNTPGSKINNPFTRGVDSENTYYSSLQTNATSGSKYFTPMGPNATPGYDSAFEGGAARKLQPKKNTKEKKVAKPIVTAIPGQRKSTGIFHSANLSPMMMTVAKVAGCLIIFVAAMSFVRVGFNSATVSAGLSANTINEQIEEQINLKNSLQVQDSALSNSSRIRNAANQYQLVSPESTIAITLPQDILSVDDNKNIKLVDSINRLASHNA